jgi:hypothetical protein
MYVIMKKVLYFAVVSVVLFSFSCNKEIIENDIQNTTDYNGQVKNIVDSTLGFTVKIQDSTLYFAEANDLLEAITILREMPVQERRKWEKSVGFVSAQTLIEDLQEKIKTIDDKDQFNQLVLANKELIKASPDDIYGIKARIYGFYPYITSKMGFFVTEAYWGRVFDGDLYSSHLCDYESYDVMRTLSVNNDVSNTKIKVLRLDFNNDNLKSYFHGDYYTPTAISLKLHDTNNSSQTKSSTFTMNIINTYTMYSTNTIESFTRYYFEVYYDTYCCNPYSYSYYNAAMGGWQYFQQVGDRRYRIEVPYEGYVQDVLDWEDGDWDDETYYQIIDNVYWYNYTGSADLQIQMIAEKKTLGQWGNFENTVIYFKDVAANYQIGCDVSGHSVSSVADTGPSGANYIEKAEGSSCGTSDFICSYTLSAYTSKPPVVFKGCVSGLISARFYPDNIKTFSYMYN